MEYRKLSDPKEFKDNQKYPEGNPPEGNDITKHLDYLKEHGFTIQEGYFSSNDWCLYKGKELILGHTYGVDQIRHVWELINGFDRQATSMICPNCEQEVRKDAISYCIDCSDTKQICLLCCSDVYEMYCKECGEKNR